MSQQLLLFDIDEPDDQPDLARQKLTDVELAANLRRLQGSFDARAKALQRCDGCNGLVPELNNDRLCCECADFSV
jgi:hypothetical protein